MGLFPSVAARLRPSSEPGGLPELARLARGGGAGLLAAALVVLGRQVGLLDGVVGLLLAALVVLAVPVSASLSRRVVISGVIVLGWLPVMWWVPVSFGSLGRATVCLAVAVGALVLWVAVAAAPSERLRRLVPRVRSVDLLPFAAAGVMAGLAARWALRGTGESALAVLTRGWDHSAHFYMTTMIRRSGAVMDRLGSGPGGDEWAYRKYPQGFHTVAATIMEVLGGPAVVDAQRELTLYVQALAVVAVVCVLLVVAAVTALPRLWRRPWIALPLTVFVAAILVLGPGGSAMVDGFPNFVLAFSLLAVVPTLTVLQGRVHSPVTLLALGGAVVGIAHGWILLLALAGPAVVAVGAPWTRKRWRGDRKQWIVTGAIAGATLVGVGYALELVWGQSLADVLAAGGGIEAAPTSQVILLVGTAIAAALGCWTIRGKRGRRAGAVTRVGLLALVPVVGVLVAVAIAVVQVRSTGEHSFYAVTGQLSYYYFKFANALAIVSAMILVTAVGVAAPRVTSPRPSGALWAGSVSLALVLTQAFGLTVPRLVDLGMGSPAPGLPRQEDWAVASRTTRPGLAGLVAAAQHYEPAEGHVVYVTGYVEGGIHPISATQWYYALTGTWTAESNEVARLVGDSADPAEVARAVLESDPGSVVVVPPEDFLRVQSAVADDGWADRVRSY